MLKHVENSVCVYVLERLYEYVGGPYSCMPATLQGDKPSVCVSRSLNAISLA